MKWGSKKKKPPPVPSFSSSSSSSCSRPSLISHVFPSSWLSKFKPKSKNSEPKPGKIEQKGKENCQSLGSPRRVGNGGGRFYGVDDDDDDAFWRLSFGEDGAEGKNRGVLRSVWYDSDKELEVEKSSCGSCKRSGGKMKGREGSQKLKGTHKSGKSKEWKLGKPNRGVLKLERDADEKKENDVLEMLAAREHHYVTSTNARNSSLKTIEEESMNSQMEDEEEEQISDWKNLKERKMEEMKAKSEKHRKSIYISRESPRRRRTKRSCKVRVCSPRTASRVEICKLKALEDVLKKAANERAVQQVRTGLNSFAVVKCSYDPQQDFRDSMVEMIVEKKITRPEDLEELLVCYLTLNSDEYHDLIIKVFRQVWFDLNQARFSAETAEGTM